MTTTLDHKHFTNGIYTGLMVEDDVEMARLLVPAARLAMERLDTSGFERVREVLWKGVPMTFDEFMERTP